MAGIAARSASRSFELTSARAPFASRPNSTPFFAHGNAITSLPFHTRPPHPPDVGGVTPNADFKFGGAAGAFSCASSTGRSGSGGTGGAARGFGAVFAAAISFGATGAGPASSSRPRRTSHPITNANAMSETDASDASLDVFAINAKGE